MSDGYGFGSGYEAREYNRVVPAGDYMVTLGMPQDKNLGGYSVRVFPIKIDGFPDHKPEDWTVFDADRNDPEKLAKWQEQRTRDFDAFGVQRGDFRPQSWQGKRGLLHFEKDAKGYMKAKWSLTEKPEQQQPASVVGQPQGAVRGEQPPFRDDVIPF